MERLEQRLIKYSDQQLDECFNALAMEWDQDDPKHFHFPNTADFVKRMPALTTDKISRFADTECPKCGGSGWETVNMQNGNQSSRRCECFLRGVKLVEAAKQQGQKLLQGSSAAQPSLPMVTGLAKQKRM